MTEFRPTRFEILPPIVKNIIIINVLVFLAQNLLPGKGINLDDLFALHSWQSEHFRPWQLLTHLFMHANFMHIFFNMLALWSFGSVLENLWGPKRFLGFYLICGLGAALLHLLTLYYQNQKILEEFYRLSPQEQDFYGDRVRSLMDATTVGASGAVSGCLAAFAYLMPNSRIIIFPIPFPLKVKWAVLGYFGVEIFLGIRNSSGDNIAHFAHLGGAIVGFILVYFWNKTNRKRFY